MSHTKLAELHVLLNDIFGNAANRETATRLKAKEPQVSEWTHAREIPSAAWLAVIASEYKCQERLPALLLAHAIAEGQKERARTNLRDPERVDAGLEFLRSYPLDEFVRTPERLPKAVGRTFNDFPGSFYPMVVVVGDKREDIDSERLTIADLGVRSASPADLRWLPNLGVRTDVVVQIDKDFVQLSENELVNRFAEVNLLVVGSPKASHLARRINFRSVFHFRYERWLPDSGCAHTSHQCYFRTTPRCKSARDCRRSGSEVAGGMRRSPLGVRRWRARERFSGTGRREPRGDCGGRGPSAQVAHRSLDLGVEGPAGGGHGAVCHGARALPGRVAGRTGACRALDGNRRYACVDARSHALPLGDLEVVASAG